jgi:diacylglycerol kinase
MTGTFIQSFGFAFRGLADAWRSERNFRVQCGYAAVMLGLGLWLRPEASSGLLVVLGMAVLLAAELMNSAVERAVDLAATEFHPLARTAKDLAASSVLLIAMTTAVINLWVLGSLMSAPAQQLAYGLLLTGLTVGRFTGGGLR